MIFMHWVFSINNRIGWNSFDNIYWRYWSAEDGHTVWSDLWTWSFISEKHPNNNNKIYHLTPYNVLIISEINNIQYEIMNKFYPLIVLGNIYLRISAQSTTKLMYTHWNLAVLCTSEFGTHLLIVSRKTYGIISSIT